MNKQEGNKQSGEIIVEKELVTNVAIKTTDVLMAVAAGAFAAAGIGVLINQCRKGAKLRDQNDFETRIISNLIAEGATEEEILNAKKILKKI